MPIDRTTNNTARPPKPTLAATRAARTPVAPRLAPSQAPASSASSSTGATGRTPRSASGSTPRVYAAHEDATPVKAFVSTGGGGGITPRSSARKSRVGVASATSTPSVTPAQTPTSSRPVSFIDFPQKEQGHGKRPTSAQSRRPKSVVAPSNHHATPRPTLSSLYTHPSDHSAREPSPMFFHANNAPNAHNAHNARPPPEQPPPSQKKTAVFFYANGEQDAGSRAPGMPSPPLSSVGRSQSESKFFHANSISDAKASPEPWSNPNLTQSTPSLRPPSPAKDNMHLSYRKGVSQVLRPSLHRGSSALSILSGTHTPESSVVGSRRKSSATTSAVRVGHAKSASLSSIDSTHSLKKVTSHEQPALIPSPLQNEKRIISDCSMPDSVASAPLEPIDALFGLPSPNVSKPAPGKSMLEHMNELAADARRERKVLDLEISNSSLLAINRSLEKEVRKQKAEIRRFRRMSRAGRFSADTVSNLEDFSAVGKTELGHLSDMSEGKEEEEPEDSSDSSDESAISTAALAERDADHRIRDEKRLQLDLSKHRDILVDSQKMNQSLGRCLTWTEELIKDAQKALEYQVHISDVRLGGRVLISDEQADIDRDEESKALLSPWTPPHRATDLDSSPLSLLEGKERDSGVDLNGIKYITTDVDGIISPLASPLGETLPRLPPTSRGFETPL
ncbi:hypothetical protein P280DRAFT_248792 [Massarina eburnea CBS 473.64]|uniref:Uncharacterized protein n=1 Tax=Massarina eburnea CBS 473.64 TaxID=1395130 RepID=A0A6A6S6M5_9PLEO|nr:hypothetical protein P280DRAFT_248792 [Massarina eburnea CBS 473.64]